MILFDNKREVSESGSHQCLPFLLLHYKPVCTVVRWYDKYHHETDSSGPGWLVKTLPKWPILNSKSFDTKHLFILLLCISLCYCLCQELHIVLPPNLGSLKQIERSLLCSPRLHLLDQSTIKNFLLNNNDFVRSSLKRTAFTGASQ